MFFAYSFQDPVFGIPVALANDRTKLNGTKYIVKGKTQPRRCFFRQGNPCFDVSGISFFSKAGEKTFWGGVFRKHLMVLYPSLATIMYHLYIVPLDHLLAFWRQGNYLEPVLLALSLCLCIVAIRKKKKLAIPNYLWVYFLSFFLSFVCLPVELLVFGAPTRYHKQIVLYTDHFFTLVEMMVFSHFFYHILKNLLIRRIILLMVILFIVYFLLFLLLSISNHGLESEMVQQAYTVENLLLAIPCVCYFIELFKKNLTLSLKKEPAFWIVTGLSFFLACTLPLSLVEPYLMKNNHVLWTKVYPLHYIFYILFFLLVLKAYLIKKPNTPNERAN